MGHRANLILVDETGYKLFYCHWCSKSIPKDIFWGPHYAIPFISQQREADGWLDDVWAEGGVLVDTSRHTLLLWGGESLLYNIPLRRLYLELLQEVWSVWKLEWAHDGIVDLAKYVGVPKAHVFSKYEANHYHEALKYPEEYPGATIVASVVLEDGTLRLFPLYDLYTHDYLKTGPSLLKYVTATSGVESLSVEDRTTEFPMGGFHIDIAKKQLAFWGANERGAVDRIVPAWTGWEVIWLKDNFEYQLERTAGRLTLPSQSDDQMLEHITNILLHDAKSSMVDFILQRAEEDRQKGHDVEINPYALRDDPLELSVEVRQQILIAAIAGWKSRKSV